MTASDSDIWIFGYGSLIWRVDFPIAEKRPAFIRDWSRKFWQGSTDHRGVPGKPGRVVTLIEAPGEICWGMAYRLPPDAHSEVMDHLDYREKGGYARLELPVYFGESEQLEGITYHATPENPNFLGDASPQEIALQIVNSIGPSGHNVEYILQLERALTELDAHDDHVVEIAGHVRDLTR